MKLFFESIRIHPIFIQLSSPWTWEDFPHSHVHRNHKAKNTDIYCPFPSPRFSLCTRFMLQAPKHKLQSVIIVKITQSWQTKQTILIFDGQNMIHTKVSLMFPYFLWSFACIFITIPCYLTQIHKKIVRKFIVML